MIQILTKYASVGLPESKKQNFDIVNRMLESKGKNVKVSDGKWQPLRNRHPNIILHTSEPLSYVKTVSSSPEITLIF